MSMVTQAKAWLGKNTFDGSHKFIIDIYNDQEKLPRGYAVKYSDKWCATFISVLAIVANMTDVVPVECGCYQMIEGFKALNEWTENDGYRPSEGDIIFYDWDDDGNGDCKGNPDHVGIVVGIDGNTIKVIEGNYKNAVSEREIMVNDRYIRGYGVPTRKDTKKDVVHEAKKDEVEGSFYRVQVGAYRIKENAVNQYNAIRKKGYEAIIVMSSGLYKVQVGAYRILENAKNMHDKIEGDGFSAYITQVGGEMVSADDVQAERFDIVVKCNLNIRKGPGTEYEVVDVIEDRDAYTIIDTDGHWGRIESGIGWISISDKYVTRL